MAIRPPALPARSVLDGSEHGVTLVQIGMPSGDVSRQKTHLVDEPLYGLLAPQSYVLLQGIELSRAVSSWVADVGFD